MDRNAFRRKAIDWDEWLADDPAAAAVPPPSYAASPQQQQAPRRAAHYAQPVRPYAPAAVPQPAQPVAPVALPPSPQPAVRRAPAPPHSWREALSVAQPTAAQSATVQPAAQQQLPQPHPSRQQQSVAPRPHASAQAMAPQSVPPQFASPVPAKRSAPTAPIAQPVPQPSQQPAQRQWHVPQQTAAAAQPAAGQQVAVAHTAPSVQQPVPSKQQGHHATVQAALRNAQSGPVAPGNDTTDHILIPTKHKRLKGRVWRSVAWVGALASAFVISFAAAVAPAYFNGHLNQQAQANSDQTASTQATDSGQTTTGSVGALSVANSGNTLQGTATQTGGDMPAGYKEIKTMYKSVALTAQRQTLPTSYKGDPANVKTAADNLNLQTTSVPTTRWGTAYIAESNGVQLALLANQQYLVVIQAQGHLTPQEWQDFLESFDGA